MTIKMFDIFYANLSKNTVGSEQGGIRPVIVIQNDIGNKFSPGVIILPITSEIKKINLPTHCLIHKDSKNGLCSDSMVLAEQIRVVDKSRLLEKIGHINNEKDKENIIKAYFANIVGMKTYNSLWDKIVNIILNLIQYDGKGGKYVEIYKQN